MARREFAQALRDWNTRSRRSSCSVPSRRCATDRAEPVPGQCPAAAPPPYRFWSLTRFGYVLVYDPQPDPVAILRFVHTKRDLPRVLADLRDRLKTDRPPLAAGRPARVAATVDVRLI